MPTPVEWRKYIAENFSFSEIKRFCVDVSEAAATRKLPIKRFEADDIKGDDRETFTLELIQHLSRRSGLPLLWEIVRNTDTYKSNPIVGDAPPTPVTTTPPPPPVHSWQAAQLRDALQSLSRDELHDLCLYTPEFKLVFNKLTDSPDKFKWMSELVEHCVAKGLENKLAAEVLKQLEQTDATVKAEMLRQQIKDHS